MSFSLWAVCVLSLLASSAALPVQPARDNNIPTDASAFSLAAGQMWGPDVSHYQGHINWAEVKKVGSVIKCDRSRPCVSPRFAGGSQLCVCQSY